MKTWNFGVIGAGLIADFHAMALNDIPNAGLVGFCDGGSGRAKILAQKYSCRAFDNYQQMAETPEIDILAIATPSGFHLEPALAAAENKKHVICEKPIEITLDRIDAMIEAHKKSGTLLGGIFPNRFNDAIAPLRNAINQGRFGTITYAGVYVPWWRTDEYYKDSWHGTWKLDGGGALMNQSIHMIDMLCDLAGPVESVQAFTATLAHDIETEDTSVAALRFKSGALGVIYGTTASFPGQLKRFEITGSTGTVVYLEDSFTLWQFADEKPVDNEIREKFSRVISLGGGAADPAAIGYENHTKNFKAFIDALETGSQFPIDGKESRKAVKLILAIYESAKEQRPVKLN